MGNVRIHQCIAWYHQKWTDESWPEWTHGLWLDGLDGPSQCLVILIYKDVPLVWSKYAIWIHLETLGGFIFDDFVWNETHGFLEKNPRGQIAPYLDLHKSDVHSAVRSWLKSSIYSRGTWNHAFYPLVI